MLPWSGFRFVAFIIVKKKKKKNLPLFPILMYGFDGNGGVFFTIAMFSFSVDVMFVFLGKGGRGLFLWVVVNSFLLTSPFRRESLSLQF